MSQHTDIDDDHEHTYDDHEHKCNVIKKEKWTQLYNTIEDEIDTMTSTRLDSIWNIHYGVWNVQDYPNGYEIVKSNKSCGARTLSSSVVSCKDKRGWSIRDHGDWIVAGDVHEDYFYWVNRFYAIHKKYGRVFGDFESWVYADTEQGYNNFISQFSVHAWDYRDI